MMTSMVLVYMPTMAVMMSRSTMLVMTYYRCTTVMPMVTLTMIPFMPAFDRAVSYMTSLWANMDVVAGMAVMPVN